MPRTIADGEPLVFDVPPEVASDDRQPSGTALILDSCTASSRPTPG